MGQQWMGRLLACRLVVRRIADMQRGRMGNPLAGVPIQADHLDICNQTQRHQDRSLSEAAGQNRSPTGHLDMDVLVEKVFRGVAEECECAAVR